MSKPSNTPNIAKAGGIMMISLFLSRVLGTVREIVIANKFGLSDATDAYVLSFQIPDLLFFLIAGGALSSAFIPVFTEYLHTKEEDDAWHMFSSITTIMSILVTAFIIIAWILAPQLTYLIAPEKGPEIQEMIIMMSRIVLPAQFAFFIGGLLFGTLYARQAFSVPGLGPNIYNIGIIFGALVLSAFITPSVAGMSWGALTGAFFGNILIPIFAMRKLGAKFKFVIDFEHEGVRRVFKLMLPVIIGLSLPGVFSMIMQYFGSYYESGVNTALNFSNRLMQAPLGVFGQSMAIGAFPALSQFFAQKNMDAYREQLAKTLRVVIFLSVPIAAFMIWAPIQIIQLFFEHGKFTPDDTARTAAALRMFAIGIPFWCVHPVLMRGYFAIQKPSVPIILGSITTFIFVSMGASVLLFKGTYPLLPLAGSLSAIVLAFMLMTRIKKDVDGLNTEGIIRTFIKAITGSLISGGFFLGILLLCENLGWMNSTLGVIFCVTFFGLVATWIYFYICKWFKMPETKYLDRALNRKKSDSESTEKQG